MDGASTVHMDGASTVPVNESLPFAPEPTVIVKAPPRRQRGLVIGFSLMITLGLAVAGVLLSSWMSGTEAEEQLAQAPALASEGDPAQAMAGTAAVPPSPGEEDEAGAAVDEAIAGEGDDEGDDAELAAADDADALGQSDDGEPDDEGFDSAAAADDAPARRSAADSRERTLRKPSWLKLRFDPSNTEVEVEVDGLQESGTSPLRVGPIEAGTHVVRIEAAGRPSVRRTVRFSAGSTERLRLTLPAPLVVEAAPPPEAVTRTPPPTPVETKPTSTQRSDSSPEAAVRKRDVRVSSRAVGNARQGKSLFGRCGNCHGKSAPSLGPSRYTQRQWTRYLALGRHGRHTPLAPLFSASQLADVKAYLLENAADVERGMAPGIR
ncbi:hypothetical protein Hoch_5228 [Haliangium ochraceum DSM 14365]|uniref:Cytochrome c domain-containing protein n=1 Tax=Haliangium ochraceum (strain DSM 14365 / JCM 11303 / SMP-2) TaxID=502025 RepID=D0LXF8_HALO1|nr:hypothetical protein Hoch_5228 [Haliangium ochraceum DSM 14365]